MYLVVVLDCKSFVSVAVMADRSALATTDDDAPHRFEIISLAVIGKLWHLDRFSHPLTELR